MFSPSFHQSSKSTSNDSSQKGTRSNEERKKRKDRPISPTDPKVNADSASNSPADDLKLFIEAVKNLNLLKMTTLHAKNPNLIQEADSPDHSILLLAFPKVDFLKFEYSEEREASRREVIKFLIQHRPNLVNMAYPKNSADKVTPLHKAVEYGMLSVVQLLFSQGAKIGLRRQIGSSIHDFFGTEINVALHFENIIHVQRRELTARYTALKEYLKIADKTHLKANCGDKKELEEILVKHPELLYIRDKDGYGLLHSVIGIKPYDQKMVDTGKYLWAKNKQFHSNKEQRIALFEAAVRRSLWSFILDAYDMMLESNSDLRSQNYSTFCAEIDMLVQYAVDKEFAIDYYLLGGFNPKYYIKFAEEFQNKSIEINKDLENFKKSNPDDYQNFLEEKKLFEELIAKGLIKEIKSDMGVSYEISLKKSAEMTSSSSNSNSNSNSSSNSNVPMEGVTHQYRDHIKKNIPQKDAAGRELLASKDNHNAAEQNFTVNDKRPTKRARKTAGDN